MQNYLLTPKKSKLISTSTQITGGNVRQNCNTPKSREQLLLEKLYSKFIKSEKKNHLKEIRVSRVLSDVKTKIKLKKIKKISYQTPENKTRLYKSTPISPKIFYPNDNNYKKHFNYVMNNLYKSYNNSFESYNENDSKINNNFSVMNSSDDDNNIKKSLNNITNYPLLRNYKKKILSYNKIKAETSLQNASKINEIFIDKLNEKFLKDKFSNFKDNKLKHVKSTNDIICPRKIEFDNITLKNKIYNFNHKKNKDESLFQKINGKSNLIKKIYGGRNKFNQCFNNNSKFYTTIYDFLKHDKTEKINLLDKEGNLLPKIKYIFDKN